MSDSLAVNLANWEERVPAHVASADYGVQRFLDDPAHLSDVVRFDLPRLGDVRGLRGVHLQCHIGTDTVSLARLGARMTGLDFSPAAVEAAGRLAAGAGADAEFVVAELHDAPEVLGEGGFDLVYTGVGALCWLPDVAAWARVVARLLAPGGRLFLREGHPVLLGLADPRPDGLLVPELPYFQQEAPEVYDSSGTYVATDVEFRATTSHSWSHGLGETVQALLDAGLRLTGLQEHTSVPWEALPGQMVPLGDGEWQLAQAPERVPHTFTLQAVRP